jgi:dUTP pyrophosphatase
MAMMLRPSTLLIVLDLPIVLLDPDLPPPSYARLGDAGLDLLASEDALLAPNGGRAVVPTGFALAIPTGYAGFVQPRSGLAAKYGVTVLNTPGLIDSGYRGELKVPLINTDPSEPYQVRRGDRIAQLVIQRVEECRIVVVSELEGENRGGGFGHTGR